MPAEARVWAAVTRPRWRGEWWLLGIFALRLPLVNPYARGDGNGYYAHVRSIVIDGDLRFDDEDRRGDPAFVASAVAPDGRISPSLDTGDGYVRNQWTVGPSLLWTAPLLLGHGAALMRGLGSTVALDGYSPPYRWPCALATAIYAVLGLGLACAAAEPSSGRRAAASAGLVLAAAVLPVVVRNQATLVPRSLVGFLGRYLADRGAVTRDLERADLERVRGYEPRR